jgi:hypothetical protein
VIRFAATGAMLKIVEKHRRKGDLQRVIFAERDMARTGGKKVAKKAGKGRKNTNTGKNSAKTEPVNVQELRERVRSVVAEKL